MGLCHGAAMAARKPPAKRPVFTRDEMSTGKGSKLARHVATVLSSPSTGNFPVLKVDSLKQSTAKDAVKDEIRYRERAANAAIVGPVLAKQKAAPADLFARQKMKEAEANLPDWDAEYDDPRCSRTTKWPKSTTPTRPTPGSTRRRRRSDAGQSVLTSSSGCSPARRNWVKSGPRRLVHFEHSPHRCVEARRR